MFSLNRSDRSITAAALGVMFLSITPWYRTWHSSSVIEAYVLFYRFVRYVT